MLSIDQASFHLSSSSSSSSGAAASSAALLPVVGASCFRCYTHGPNCGGFGRYLIGVCCMLMYADICLCMLYAFAAILKDPVAVDFVSNLYELIVSLCFILSLLYSRTLLWQILCTSHMCLCSISNLTTSSMLKVNNDNEYIHPNTQWSYTFTLSLYLEYFLDKN